MNLLPSTDDLNLFLCFFLQPYLQLCRAIHECFPAFPTTLSTIRDLAVRPCAIEHIESRPTIASATVQL